jgi:hypothetical protein
LIFIAARENFNTLKNQLKELQVTGRNSTSEQKDEIVNMVAKAT